MKNMTIFDALIWLVFGFGVVTLLFMIMGLVFCGLFVYSVIKDNIDWNRKHKNEQ